MEADVVCGKEWKDSGWSFSMENSTWMHCQKPVGVLSFYFGAPSDKILLKCTSCGECAVLCIPNQKKCTQCQQHEQDQSKAIEPTLYSKRVKENVECDSCHTHHAEIEIGVESVARLKLCGICKATLCQGLQIRRKK